LEKLFSGAVVNGNSDSLFSGYFEIIFSGADNIGTWPNILRHQMNQQQANTIPLSGPDNITEFIYKFRSDSLVLQIISNLRSKQLNIL